MTTSFHIIYVARLGESPCIWMYTRTHKDINVAITFAWRARGNKFSTNFLSPPAFLLSDHEDRKGKKYQLYCRRKTNIYIYFFFLPETRSSDRWKTLILYRVPRRRNYRVILLCTWYFAAKLRPLSSDRDFYYYFPFNIAFLPFLLFYFSWVIW